MLVVSDTTALSCLFKIGRLSLLPAFSPQILIPLAVRDELKRLEEKGYDLTPIWSAEWLHIEQAQNKASVAKLMLDLDAGESEAIVLALEKHAGYLLIDEKDGRAKAAEMGIPTIGMIGILLTLKENQRLPAVKPVLDELRNVAGFYLSDSFCAKILASVGE